MKLPGTWMTLVTACGWSAAAWAQLQLVPDTEPQQAFAGDARNIAVVWHNPGDKTAEAEIRTRLFQTTSATAVRLGEVPWKKLQVLPGQTVLESASLNFPAVKAETKFIVQWLEGTNHVLGKTEVLVYPTNLLAELKPLAGENRAVGVFDPGNILKPLLKCVRVEFDDLEDSGVASFRGRLAIIGPFASRPQMAGDLAERIGKLGRNGVGAVWIQPPPSPRDPWKPSFYTVPFGTNAVVVAQADLVAGLAERPQSRLRLLQLCRLALNPEPPALPAAILQP